MASSEFVHVCKQGTFKLITSPKHQHKQKRSTGVHVHFAGETARAIVKLEEGVGVLGSQLRTKIAGVRTRIRQRNSSRTSLLQCTTQ